MNKQIADAERRQATLRESMRLHEMALEMLVRYTFRWDRPVVASFVYSTPIALSNLISGA